MKRSLLLSTATRRGLAGACLSLLPPTLQASRALFSSPLPFRRSALLSLPPILQAPSSVSFTAPLSFRRLTRTALFSSAYQKRTKHRLVLSMFSHILPQLTDSNAMQLGYAGLRYFHNLRNLVHIQFFHII